MASALSQSKTAVQDERESAANLSQGLPRSMRGETLPKEIAIGAVPNDAASETLQDEALYKVLINKDGWSGPFSSDIYGQGLGGVVAASLEECKVQCTQTK